MVVVNQVAGTRVMFRDTLSQIAIKSWADFNLVLGSESACHPTTSLQSLPFNDYLENYTFLILLELTQLSVSVNDLSRSQLSHLELNQ
jgi:hypothetical protein